MDTIIDQTSRASKVQKTTHIYIQGCARSGNTLMRELCLWSFPRTRWIKPPGHGEATLELLVQPRRQWFWQKGSVLYVASRDAPTSHCMCMETLHENPGVRVIWMLRNPLDVLTSVHGDKPNEFYVRPDKLLSSLQLYKKFQNEPQILPIHYEDLVSNPEAVQKKITTAFELEPIRSFTESHNFFSRSRDSLNALHSVRPVDSNSVGKWKNNPIFRDHLKKVLADFPDIIPMARAGGYEIDPAAL